MSEHYIVEVSIKRIYREQTTPAMRGGSSEHGERKHSEVVKLIKQAPTLAKAILLTNRHLEVELDEVLPGE